jgi:pyridoxal phosphate enzyme (YggS family)
MSLTIIQLKESLDSIKLRIRSAAERSGQNLDEIVVVAVTKTVGAETLKALADLGWPDIGENRVADAIDKARTIPHNRFIWHMIGHLQSNKVKKAVGLFDYIHSLDSIPLTEELQAEALRINKAVRVLIQVNVSNEATKSGIKPEELTDFYRRAKDTVSSSAESGLIISGLMTMAPIVPPGRENDVRPYFRKLRELRDKLKSDFVDDAASEELKYLSMGMSQDFEVAIEEGANMLRIGTAIFS